MKNVKISDCDSLEKKVREIRNRIRLSARTCPSGKIANTRKHLNMALQSDTKCSPERRSVIFLKALRQADEELDNTRRDFHSGQIKLIRQEIAETLKKYKI